MLLVGVPIDPLIVVNSLGENSGSLIGPLGTNGVRIAEGDWSIPRFWRYSYKKNTNPRHTGIKTGPLVHFTCSLSIFQ